MEGLVNLLSQTCLFSESCPFNCIIDRRSLMSVQHWLGRVRAEVGDVPVLLVMNKIDLIQESQVNM